MRLLPHLPAVGSELPPVQDAPCRHARTPAPPRRARLSYEAFSHFLHAIKELNAGRQSREEALRAARATFGEARCRAAAAASPAHLIAHLHPAGPANTDLYATFESLLMRSAMGF